MSEMSFEQMLDESFKTIHNGEVLEGKVISVREDYAVLNIGYKADGILTRDEYSNTPVDLTTVISVGDELTVKVLKVNDGEGQVALSYKRLAAEKANKRLEEAFENKEVLKAPVVQILKGGLSVDVEGGRVFIPASLVSDNFERDLNKYLNQEIEFVITEFVLSPKKRIIGDRKQLIVAQKEAAKKALFERIKVGDVVEGVVKSVVDFGAFVELAPGIDALLHVSQISREHVAKPSDVLSIGQEIQAKVVDFNGEDKKISLSMKALEADRDEEDAVSVDYEADAE